MNLDFLAALLRQYLVRSPLPARSIARNFGTTELQIHRARRDAIRRYQREGRI